jgi:hypothetical protein
MGDLLIRAVSWRAANRAILDRPTRCLGSVVDGGLGCGSLLIPTWVADGFAPAGASDVLDSSRRCQSFDNKATDTRAKQASSTANANRKFNDARSRVPLVWLRPDTLAN